MNIEKMFGEQDKKLIMESVARAEAKTSGEIVPYVVDSSDAYEIAEWRASTVAGVLAFAVFALVRSFSAAWEPFDVAGIAIVTLGVGILGMLAAKFVPAVKRACAGGHLIDRRVEQRAAEAFIAEEVFRTEARTGILIFVSMLERRVLVVGDSGINAKVRKEDWQGVVSRVVDGIKAGQPAGGLVEAITMCGGLLEGKGVARSPKDRDELPDDLRIGRS
jgi:putative membrane protein